MSPFANISEEELRNLVKEKDAKRTQKATDQSWRTFESYCEEKSIVFNINMVSLLHVSSAAWGKSFIPLLCMGYHIYPTR